jgi:hypothetical protein
VGLATGSTAHSCASRPGSGGDLLLGPVSSKVELVDPGRPAYVARMAPRTAPHLEATAFGGLGGSFRGAGQRPESDHPGAGRGKEVIGMRTLLAHDRQRHHESLAVVEVISCAPPCGITLGGVVLGERRTRASVHARKGAECRGPDSAKAPHEDAAAECAGVEQAPTA